MCRYIVIYLLIYLNVVKAFSLKYLNKHH